MYPQIDYHYRPNSYWEDAGVLASLLRDVKGTERRRLIADSWRHGRLEELPEELLKSTLCEQARDGFGRIHPFFMGGEYLPDYLGRKTEIARLELRFTTADVMSIRARRDGRLLRYRIVDEYDTEFEQQRQSSRKPLTLEQLVRFVDGSRHPGLSSGLAMGYSEMNEEDGCSREKLRHFTTVRSELYPQLEKHYDQVFAEWVEELV